MTTIPEIDRPPMVYADLLYRIREGMANHPRSQQSAIGPSGLAEPCTRALLHALNADRPPKRGGPYDGWLATIGTATHAWLADTFNAADPQRYLTEASVMVGEVGGLQVWGTVDLYDTATQTAVDWKVLGPTSHDKVRLNGPGPRYEGQLQCYAKGLNDVGLPCRQVILVAFSRVGGLDTAIMWSADYDPAHAAKVLARADGLARLIATVGMSAALEYFAPCEDWHCPWCRSGRRQPPPEYVELPLPRGGNTA